MAGKTLIGCHGLLHWLVAHPGFMFEKGRSMFVFQLLVPSFFIFLLSGVLACAWGNARAADATLSGAASELSKLQRLF
jgi:hypothetical protein